MTRSFPIETSHGRLAARETGPAGGIPLVLLQRFRGTMDDWDPAFLDAISADRRVVWFDSAGVGRSAGKTPESIAGMAAVAAEAIESLDAPTRTCSAGRSAGWSHSSWRWTHPTWCAA